MPLLTKSKYIVGLQCPKYLWMMFHDLDKIPDFDPATEFIIEQGNRIGKLAKKLFPEGVDLPEKDFKLNLKKTEEGIKERKTLFEAGIISGDLYARADVLVPVGKDQWDVIEVKASTKVKDEHLHDVSFQKYVYEKAGLKIRNCFLMHVNGEFVKDGEINPKEILVQQEITGEVKEAIEGIQERIDAMLKIVNDPKAPEVSIKDGCNNGLDCVSEDCWSFLPESHVFELYRGKKKSLELLEAEVFALKDIPPEFKLNGKQTIQKKCAKSGETHVNKEGIKKFLEGLQYPLYYFDFETFNTAVPLYEKTKPYQQIPFQFSLHVDDGKKVKHFEFLHDSQEDPREKILLEMKKVLGTKGSILVFYQSFEISRLTELAEAFPQHKKWIDSIIERIIDLIIPFQNFDYYNPQQKGSCSIKKVLPAITGKGYNELNINNGGLASVTYFESVFGNIKNTEQVRKDLLEYCKLDTEGMVWIVEELRRLIK
jgi:hypothetical protein